MSDLGKSAEAKIRQRAREQAGVLLPDIDPNVGEMLLATIYANPEVGLADLLLSLVLAAPPGPLAGEFIKAGIELAVCKELGQLTWLETEAQSILMGVRKASMKSAFHIGATKWPMAALFVGPPQLVTIGHEGRRIPLWLACEGLDGAVLRMSEVIALGQIMVETFGAKIIEDRHGPETMHESFIEQRMSERAKMRAEAKGAADRVTLVQRSKSRGSHARVAIAESMPGLLGVGERIKPEHDKDAIFEVERRVNRDYVVAVAIDPKTAVAPGNWLYEDERHPSGIEELGRYVGFSDDDAVPHAADEPSSEEEPGDGDSP